MREKLKNIVNTWSIDISVWQLEFIDIANDFQKYKVSDKHHFLFFSEVIPKNNIYLKYVRRKKTMDWPQIIFRSCSPNTLKFL